MTAAARRGIMVPMSEILSPAALLCRRIEAKVPGVVTLIVPRDLAGAPLRDGEHVLRLEWESRPNPMPDAIARRSRVEAWVEKIRAELPPGVYVAVEGVCRIVEGGQRFGKKTTAVVVHVIATGEPARIVLVPSETKGG